MSGSDGSSIGRPYARVARREHRHSLPREAITIAEQTQLDVVLLNLRLPDMLGPEVIHGIRRGAPDARVVRFTAYADHAAVEPALAAGARAVVLQDADRADLVRVVRRVAAGLNRLHEGGLL